MKDEKLNELVSQMVSQFKSMDDFCCLKDCLYLVIKLCSLICAWLVQFFGVDQLKHQSVYQIQTVKI